MGSHLQALLAALVALGVTAAVTPLAASLARLVGAIDQPRGRGLAAGGTPLLGGVAMLIGVEAALFLALAPFSEQLSAVAEAAIVITIVGALDDRFDLLPGVKLVGQVAAAVLVVTGGVVVDNVTIPFIGPVVFGSAGGPLTVVGLVAVMNIVNFSDGIDGLAAGVTAIAALAFAIVAFDLGKVEGGTLAAITAGAALGFLLFNFHPASIYMGDAGSNLLGLLLGCTAVLGAVKTQAALALVFPFLILAVPVLDTAFVVLKRLKYRQPVYHADREHFHHRLDRIGFSTRRTVLVLYGWTLAMASVAVVSRFVQPFASDGSVRPANAIILATLFGLAIAASVFVVYVLEILKFERDGRRVRVRMGGPAPRQVDAAREDEESPRDDEPPAGESPTGASGSSRRVESRR
ncbi:MAG: undecaprenyl/decaprenyl-phosphate alpha-N-acetylglucosaminyl 1-phosphate transferase [Solirubrobacteraceae bacterium]|nr:undecaprenyl/decaprenyl-phosphate alpha-N-acetylglucosaminyl 1-phosphate transferase [Solirubrobacteraceae bacterium]